MVLGGSDITYFYFRWGVALSIPLSQIISPLENITDWFLIKLSIDLLVGTYFDLQIILCFGVWGYQFPLPSGQLACHLSNLFADNNPSLAIDHESIKLCLQL